MPGILFDAIIFFLTYFSRYEEQPMPGPAYLTVLSLPLVLLMIFSSGFYVQAQEIPKEQLRCIHAPGIESFDYSTCLQRIATSATVIGLGEATHGTADFFLIKTEIIKTLVTQYGYRHFLLEAGYIDCLGLNDYIHGGKTDPAYILNRRSPWPWACREVMQMLDWMKSYNQGKKSGEQIEFYGMDLSNAYILRFDKDKSVQAVHADLYRQVQSLYKDSTLSPAEKRSNLRKKEKQLRKDQNYTGTQKNLLLNFVETAIYLQLKGGQSYAYREKKMAENVIRIQEQLTPGEKIMIWAHNAHVSRKSNARESMGAALQKHYGSSYQAIGFEFCRGSFLAVNIDSAEKRKPLWHYHFEVDADPETLGAALSGINKGLLGIDLHITENRKLLCNRKFYLHEIGAVYGHQMNRKKPALYREKIRLCQAFDILLIVEKTRASTPLP